MILSDRWIDRQCNKKSCALLDKNYQFIKWLGNTLPVETMEELSLGQHREMLRDPKLSMIEPYSRDQIKELNIGGTMVGAISSGRTSFGYDVTIGETFKLFTNINTAEIDPKNMRDECFVIPELRFDPHRGHYVLCPPHGYLLGHTLERFQIPRDVLVVCLGKSTYARAGIIINVTPIEPEFEGTVVIEISNPTTLPARIYVNEGIAQFLFLQGNEECEVSYKDRGGKYQGQQGIVDAKV